MLHKKLKTIFGLISLIALVFFLSNVYSSYKFHNTSLSDDEAIKIYNKEQEILSNMQRNFGYVRKFPLVISDQFKGRLYGLTSYQNGSITIYLNKKVMQESMDYVLDNVIAHEYAHALMFELGNFQVSNEGHSKKWQNICFKLGGKECKQYVNTQEIIMSKMPF